jgi:gluconate kinase
VRVVILRVDEATLVSRLRARHGHFFPARLLASQLAELEPPGAGERTLSVAAVGEPGEVAAEIIRRLGLSPAAKRAAR